MSLVFRNTKYEELFDYMFNNHNVTLLESDMDEILGIAKDSQIVWHKYPEEKPEKYKDYLITVKTENETFVNKDTWREGGEWDEYIDRYIIAWADTTYPEPYKEEK